jgi:ABC-type glycerol-3-phosphate transport system permease component
MARRSRNLLLVGISLLILVWALGPLYLLVLVSLTPETATVGGLGLPRALSLEHYRQVLLSNQALWHFLYNSTAVGLGTVAAVLALSLPAAYALARWRSLLSRLLYTGFFWLRMFPPISLTIPFYLIFSKAGLLDTKLGLTLALVPLNIPLAVWILAGFIGSVPRELEEAAWIDGASQVRTLTRIVLPVAVNGIIATAIFVFLEAYTHYLLALVVTNVKAAPLTIFIAGQQTDYRFLIGPMLAAAFAGTLPMVVLYMVSLKHLKRVAVAGGITI